MADALKRYQKRLETLKREAKQFDGFMSDEENDVDQEALKEEEDKFVRDYSMCVVVDNLPKVPQAKFDKLCNVIKKLFSQMGEIVQLEMPFEEGSSTTAGCAFIAFQTAEDAKKAILNVNQFALDKRHTLLVNEYDDVDKFIETPDVYTIPEKTPFQDKPDLNEWLADSKGRDMFALRYGAETEIHWSENGQTSLKSGFSWNGVFSGTV